MFENRLKLCHGRSRCCLVGYADYRITGCRSDKALWVEKEMVKLLPAIVKTAQSCFCEVLVYEERLIGLLAISSLSL